MANQGSNNMIHAATIVTHNYIDHALTLHESLKANHSGPVKLHILIVNPHRNRLINLKKLENVQIHLAEDLSGDTEAGQLARIIISKYSYLAPDTKIPKNICSTDYLRWALKPVFLRYLFHTEKMENIILCDCDLHFYNSFDFIIDNFKDNRILLTPHWREIKPAIDNGYKWNFLHGFYNAGFVGIRKDATDMLDWWAEMCAIECSAELNSRGTYVDQKYLDAVPLYFDGVCIIKHKGCNVAAWNIRELPRAITPEGKVTVAGQPLIFIHYSKGTIGHITDGMDVLLYESYFQYQQLLREKRLELVRKGMLECVSQVESESQQVI